MSTLEKLQAAIIQYVSEKQADYALMVNGAWGSGKTHFIKNKLFPELKKCNPDFKLIYMSLFGVTGSVDLNRKIYLEVYPILNSKAAKTIGAIGKAVIANLGFSGIDKEDQIKLLETIGSIDTNTLIVFDDLERVDGDLLIEILGFINQLVEHNNIKVIISANENEIAEISNGSPSYKRYVEKVVRHKFLFQLDFRIIGNEIIASTGIDQKYNQTILDAFEKGENYNLRTLQFVCSMVLKVLDSLGKFTFPKVTIKEIVEHMSLYFIATMAIDLKANRMRYIDFKKLASWSVDKPIDYSQIDFTKIEIMGKDDGKPTKEKERSAQQEFFNRYFSPNQMMYIDSLVEYIESGFWDEKRFITDVESITNYLTTKGASESSKLLEVLFEITRIEDDKIEDVVNAVMKYVSQGEYPIEKYLKIYLKVKSFIDYRLIAYDAKHLYKDIMTGIDSCKDTQPAHYIEDFFSIPDDADVRVKKLYDRTVERNQEIKSKSFSEESEGHLEAFFTDPDAYNRKYLLTQGGHIPCFHFSCSPKDFLRRYSKMSNENKSILNGIFYQRQKTGIQMDRTELAWMRDLKKKVEKEIKSEKPMVSTINKEGLRQRLGKLIEHWERFESQLES